VVHFLCIVVVVSDVDYLYYICICNVIHRTSFSCQNDMIILFGFDKKINNNLTPTWFDFRIL